MRQLKQRAFGELVGLSFQLSVELFLPLFVIGALFGLPNLVLQFLTQEMIGEDPMIVMVLALAAIPVMLICGMIAQGASILIVSGAFTGRPVSIGDAISGAIGKIGSLFAVAMIVGLLIGFGFMACILPGLIFMAWYYVSAPAVMVEDLGFGDAMARSKALTENNRGRVLGFIIVLSLIVLGATIGVQKALGMAPLPGLAAVGINYVAATAIGVVAMVGPVVYYFDARVGHDGFGLENLASFVDQIGARGAKHQGFDG